MSKTFVLAIRLGNEGMETSYDIAQALDRLSRFIGNRDLSLDELDGPVEDRNGNRVGSFQVQESTGEESSKLSGDKS